MEIQKYYVPSLHVGNRNVSGGPVFTESQIDSMAVFAGLANDVPSGPSSNLSDPLCK
jgi:hypothetical protein